MGRSDDSIQRRRSKKSRKKQENNKVSNRIASIIAAKKRRLSGKRRMCQGMCFSLPTPEDPFNDRHAKIDHRKKKKRPNKNNLHLKKGSTDGEDANNFLEQEAMKSENVGHGTSGTINKIRQSHAIKDNVSGSNGECPSNFLIMCLNTIQQALFNIEVEKPLFANTWGYKFWNSYSTGKIVLETSVADSTIEQIAWVVSSAADTIARKEKEGVPFAGPFLLFLVPSQEKALKVRQVCKPLKSLGIHTVSLHPGASIDHQIHGLKSCEPEFLVSTPDRLLELVSLKAVDISGISLLVVDGLEAAGEGNYFDMIKSVRQLISGNPQTMIFSYSMSNSYISLVQKLFGGSVCRLSSSASANSQKASIMSVNM